MGHTWAYRPCQFLAARGRAARQMTTSWCLRTWAVISTSRRPLSSCNFFILLGRRSLARNKPFRKSEKVERGARSDQAPPPHQLVSSGAHHTHLKEFNVTKNMQKFSLFKMTPQIKTLQLLLHVQLRQKQHHNNII